MDLMTLYPQISNMLPNGLELSCVRTLQRVGINFLDTLVLVAS